MGYEPVRDALLAVPGVRAIHDLHLWSLTLTYHMVSTHLAIGESGGGQTPSCLIFPPNVSGLTEALFLSRAGSQAGVIAQ